MFLQVIWNKKFKQTSLLVSDNEFNEEYPIVASFSLKKQVSTACIQNFIAFKDFNFSYLEESYFWLENISLTKNILALFNVLDFIELNAQDLIEIDKFFVKNKISIDDFDNLGFQSPVKTIERDLSTQPKFMEKFLNIGDSSKRLLRTTFQFQDDNILITINKRPLPIGYFLNHLNSNRDRIRIQESLAFPFDKQEEFLTFFSHLHIFKVHSNDMVIEEDLEVEEIVVDNSIDSSDSLSNSIHYNEHILEKEKTISLNFISFIDNLQIVESKDLENNQLTDKQLAALEDFKNVEPFEDFFAIERTSEDFSGLNEESYTQEYDNSVYIEKPLENNLLEKSLDIAEELTEDFLVEIETNLALKEKQNLESITHVNIDEESTDIDNETKSVSVEDLVDSINDIIEETFSLELIDIIELPLIAFLSEPVIEEIPIIANKEVIENDNFDNYFIDNDVNNEINTVSAEEVLNVVQTEVSIFENIVIDKKKNKGKNKKDKHVDNLVSSSIINEHIEKITSPELPIVSQIIVPVLENLDTISLHVIDFISFLEIKKPLLIHKQEEISIIEFLLSAQLVEDIIEVSNEATVNEVNFNFFEDSQRKLIDLAMEGKIEEIEDLYRNYPDFEKPLLNFNYQGDNPLCIASFNENLELLKKLIDFGWNPNYFDSNLNNALIIACAEGHKHIVRYLLTQELQINFQNKKGYTALHFAVNDCNHRIVKLLLEAGVDVDLSDNDRNTPLSIAAFKGDINSTKLLLQTRMNVHTKNKKGYDARTIALLAKNHAIAKLIEDKIVSEKHNHSLPPIIEKNV